MAQRLIVAILLLPLFAACVTPRVVRLDTGQGAPHEHRPPTSVPKSLRLSAKAFEEALADLLLNAPLALRPSQQGWLVRISYPSNGADTQWQRLMSRSFASICEVDQRREDCLSFLDDVMGLSEWDKLGVALGLSLEPMRDSISKAVEDTLAPHLFYALIATGLVGWVVLATNPEPVFTKAAAIISALLLICVGVEIFMELVDASRDLKRATDQATTLAGLQQAGQRFANRVGPEVARMIILTVTMVISHGLIGGSAWLATRMAMLPSFSEAAAVAASRLGIHLANVGQVSTVAIVGNTLTISLPATAVAMAAHGLGGGGSPTGATATSVRSWGSFSGLKSALGSAGNRKQWHHIVEQTEGNVQRFGPHAIHNTENVIPLDETLHTRVSALYSRKNLRITNLRDLTVRQWLSTQSYEAQRAFGLRAIANVKSGVW